jgi:hypothetical protein
MATAKLSDEALLAILQARPTLRARIASIVSAIENSAGDLKEAGAAEERTIEEMRLLGREALQRWGGEAGGGDGERNSAATSYASPR